MKNRYTFSFFSLSSLCLVCSALGQNLSEQVSLVSPSSRVTDQQLKADLIADFKSKLVKQAIKEAGRKIEDQYEMNQIVSNAFGKLRITTEFFRAVENNDTQMLQFILERMSEIPEIDSDFHPAIDVTRDHGETALHAAAGSNSLGSLRILLASLPDGGSGFDAVNNCRWVDRIDKFNQTPLDVVLRKGLRDGVSQECCELLIDAGANEALEKCFFKAVLERDVEFCQKLLPRQVDFSYCDKDDKDTVFHLIAQDKRLSEKQIQIEDDSISFMLLMLRELGKRYDEGTLSSKRFFKIVLSKNSDKFSSLHLAAREDSLDSVKEIVLFIAKVNFFEGIRRGSSIEKSLEPALKPIWEDQTLSDPMKKFFAEELEQFIDEQLSE